MTKERQAVIKFAYCYECPFHMETEGICGSASWCKHPSKKRMKQICGKNCERDFPTWCPLGKSKV
jgi:hypothetical protein